MRHRAVLRIFKLSTSCAAIALLLFAQLSCTEKAEPQPVPPQLIEVEEISPGPFEVHQPVSGLLQPNRASLLAFEEGGKIVDVRVKLGDVVETGDVLLILNDSMIRAQLAQAEASSDIARKNFQRVERLRQHGVSSDEEYERSLAERDLQAARLEEAQLRLERTKVKSPFSGRIKSVLVELNEVVAPGQPACEVLETDPIKLTVYVPEFQIATIHTGQEVNLTFWALNDEHRSAEVSRIAPAPKGPAPLYPVEIDLPNPDQKLVSGMLGTGYIITSKELELWQIPVESLVTIKGQKSCVIEDRGSAKILPLPSTYQLNRGVALVKRMDWPQFQEQKIVNLIVKGHKTLGDGSAVKRFVPEAAAPL